MKHSQSRRILFHVGVSEKGRHSLCCIHSLPSNSLCLFECQACLRWRFGVCCHGRLRIMTLHTMPLSAVTPHRQGSFWRIALHWIFSSIGWEAEHIPQNKPVSSPNMPPHYFIRRMPGQWAASTICLPAASPHWEEGRKPVTWSWQFELQQGLSLIE